MGSLINKAIMAGDPAGQLGMKHQHVIRVFKSRIMGGPVWSAYSGGHKSRTPEFHDIPVYKNIEKSGEALYCRTPDLPESPSQSND